MIQVFDSWAGSLSPEDYDIFALPYQKMVVKAIKDKHPNTPVIIYIAKSGALVERMANTGRSYSRVVGRYERKGGHGHRLRGA